MNSTPRTHDVPAGADSRGEIVPQRQLGLCSQAAVDLDIIDQIPLLVLDPEEKKILQREAERLSAQLLGPDSTEALRQLLAKRLALLDQECQRMAAVQEICLRGTTDASIRKAREVTRLVNSAHRRFVATAELFQRLTTPSVRVSIRNAEQVAVVDARRTT